MNSTNPDILAHHVTTAHVTSRSSYIRPPPFYSFPLLHYSYTATLSPIKKNPKYATVKSKTNSNYKQTIHKETPSNKLETIVE